MYCQNCGQKLPEGAKFCQNCGQEVNKAVKSDNSNFDVNEIVGETSNLIKNKSGEFKNKWNTWSARKKVFSIIVCCCIGWIVITSIAGVLTPDKNSEIFDETNEGKNISLIKESTSGYAFYSSGKTVYQYDLRGVLKNIPEDSNGFTVRGTFYGDDGKSLGEDEMDLDYFEYSSENSNPESIVSLQKYEFVNVSEIQVTILNPDGDVVFDETFDYDMNEFDLSGLDDKPETDDDNDDLETDYESSSSFSDDDTSSSSSSSSSSMTFVASVNSDKFHYPSCSAAKRIKDSNKIYFSSRDEAISRGYSPCGICTP